MKKNYLLYILLLLFAATIWIGCSEWTDAKAKDYFQGPSDEYYESLRAYKKSKHQITFGWFGNWSGEGAALTNSLIGIPDSVDMVSIWGNWSDMTPAKKADLEFCQKVKGTKFLLCLILRNIGDQATPQEVRDNYEENGFPSEDAAVKDYWGWIDADNEAIEMAIRKYANAICDTVDRYNYDGFDIDFEPNFGNPGNMASYGERMLIFANELSKRLGPKSNTGKILVVDGEPQTMPAESGEYFDYFIVQAYKSPNDKDLDKRLLGTVTNYEGHLTEQEVTNKYIVTENFESVSAAMDGGYPFKDRNNNEMKSLEGMARWKPNNGFEKGGVGTYHMEAEFPTNPEYKNLRKAIQIMNPSAYPLIKY
mgnify:CR=1 FL=1